MIPAEKTMLHWIIAVIIAVYVNAQVPDPCQGGQHSVLRRSSERGTSCKAENGDHICDRYIDEKWYRVLDEDNNAEEMVTSCPQNHFICSTQFPIWMNGSHPSIIDGIVSRDVCIRESTSCCDSTLSIQVKNCTSYFIYFLRNPDFCPSGYCFGVKPCPPPDPCDEANHVVMKEVDRRFASCSGILQPNCDSKLEKKWYRIGNHSEIDPLISTKCGKKCGTVNPIWLNGTLPTVSEMIVNRTACSNNGQSCCGKSYDIQLKNCSAYMVYNLVPTDSCPESYCFGVKPCPPDPCNETNHVVMKEVDRRFASCSGILQPNCDSKLEKKWHRIGNHSEIDQLISTKCGKKCGTVNPIWLNGTLPTVSEMIVNRTACVNNGQSCCGKSYDIQLKNCSAYMVYNLVPTDSCPESYCFGNAPVCLNMGSVLQIHCTSKLLFVLSWIFLAMA